MGSMDTDDEGLEGLNDPALLAEIEAEFAELRAEIDRISAMPATSGPRKAELLRALRKQWRERPVSKDQPAWRAKLDVVVGAALEQIMAEGLQEGPGGNMQFQLQGSSLQDHGGPVLSALLDGFQAYLAEKFPASPPAPPKGKVAAPPTPLQGLVAGLGQMLSKAVSDARTAAAEQGKRAAGAGGTKEGAPKPGALDTTTVMEEVNLETAVGFDTRKGDQLPPVLPELFQRVVAGLGGILGQAAAPPAPAPSAEAKASAPPAEPDAPGPPAGGGAEAEDTGAAEVGGEAPGGEPEVKGPTLKIDFPGLLSQLFKINAPPPAAAEAAPEASPAADAPPEAPLPPEEPLREPARARPGPVNPDFAAILGALFKKVAASAAPAPKPPAPEPAAPASSPAEAPSAPKEPAQEPPPTPAEGGGTPPGEDAPG